MHYVKLNTKQKEILSRTKRELRLRGFQSANDQVAFDKIFDIADRSIKIAEDKRKKEIEERCATLPI